jgi:hypothetical protein
MLSAGVLVFLNLINCLADVLLLLPKRELLLVELALKASLENLGTWTA